MKKNSFNDEKDFKNTYNLYERLIRKKTMNEVKDLIKKVKKSIEKKIINFSSTQSLSSN